MGGGNAQKSAAAREKKNKDMSKTDEERKEAKAKADKVSTGGGSPKLSSSLVAVDKESR